MNPKISVIVPIYNIPLAYFKLCFNSLLAQTYTDFEIILVDDNNYGDETARYIDDLASNYPHVIALHQVNSGVSVARNLGLANATGEWVMFVDPDDWAEDNLIEVLMEHISPDLDMIACATWVNYKTSQVLNQFFPEGRKVYANGEIEQMQLQLIAKGITDYFPPEIGFGVPWAKLYRRLMLDTRNLQFIPDLMRMQDNIFNLYALEYSRAVLYIPDALYHYRKEEGSASNAYQPNVINYYERVNEETERFINRFNKGTLFYQALAIKVSLCFHSYFNQYFFSKKYPHSKHHANRTIKDMIVNTYYADSINQVDFKYLLLKEKLFMFLLKLNNVRLLRFIFWAEHTLRMWKKGNMNREIKEST